MLQSIRERAQGAIAVIIVLFLCLTFAVWGVESYLNEARKVIVAEVNGDEIELSEYQETFQRLRQRAQAELGEGFDSAVWSQDSTKQKALDYLVEERVLTQNVDRARLRLSLDQVAEFLKTSPNFQVDGKFSSERYAQVTSGLGFSEHAYEAQARKDLALQQLRTGVVASAFITPQELSRVEQLQGETRNVGYAVIAPTDSAKETITDQEVSAHFTEHQEDYRVEDKVALEFVELKLEDLVPGVAVSDEELQQYYITHKADFTVEEQRNASHILVQLKADATSTADAAAKQKASELRKLVLDGKPFAEVAKAQSDDIGSRAEGGATGLFGRGVMAPEFEQAVFSMTIGDLSEPVKTSFGYHIIKLTEIKPGGTTPLAEVRATVEQKVRQEKAEDLYYETVERFSDTIYEHPDSLAEAADQLAMKVQIASLQSRAEVAAVFNTAVADAVWEAEILSQGLASAPIEIGDTRIVAVRVTQYVPAHLPSLHQVKANVVAELQSRHVRDAARAHGEALLARLKKGEAGAKVSAEAGLKWEEFKDAGREDGRLNRAVLRAAFKAPVEKIDDKAYLGVEFGNGNYALVEVSRPGSSTNTAEAVTSAPRLNEQLTRARSIVAWRDFVTALKSSAKISTHPEKL